MPGNLSVGGNDIVGASNARKTLHFLIYPLSKSNRFKKKRHWPACPEAGVYISTVKLARTARLDLIVIFMAIHSCWIEAKCISGKLYFTDLFWKSKVTLKMNKNKQMNNKRKYICLHSPLSLNNSDFFSWITSKIIGRKM